MSDEAPTVAVTEAAPEQTAADTPQADAAPQQAEQAPAADDPDLVRLERIAAQERRVRAREKAMRAEQAQLKAQMAEVEKLRRLPELAKQDPVAFLTETGIDYNDLTSRFLRGEIKTPPKEFAEVAEIKAKLEALEAERAAAIEHARKQSTQQALAADRERTATEFAAVAESYPMLSFFEGGEVAETIQRVRINHHRRTQSHLDVRAAADKLEAELAKRFPPDKLAQLLQRLQASTAASAAGDATSPVEETQSGNDPASPGPRTLTKRLQSRTTASPAKSDADRRARALARLTGR